MFRKLERAVVAEVKDCPFCDLGENPKTPFDVSSPIDGQGDVLIKPDLGMMMPGHLLAVTANHLTSFAQLGRQRLWEVDQCLSSYEEILAKKFGSYFRLEHGSDSLRASGSGACIDHAHTHLIPADEDVGPHIQEQLAWQELDAYEDLADFNGAPYIYLGRLAMHYVVVDPQLPGQWVRRQVAQVRGLDHWDWAVCDSRGELKETMEKLEGSPLGIFNVTNQGGTIY